MSKVCQIRRECVKCTRCRLVYLGLFPIWISSWSLIHSWLCFCSIISQFPTLVQQFTPYFVFGYSIYTLFLWYTSMYELMISCPFFIHRDNGGLSRRIFSWYPAGRTLLADSLLAVLVLDHFSVSHSRSTIHILLLFLDVLFRFCFTDILYDAIESKKVGTAGGSFLDIRCVVLQCCHLIKNPTLSHGCFQNGSKIFQ